MNRVLLSVLIVGILCVTLGAARPTITVSAEPLNGGTITNRQCGQFIEYLCNLVPGLWAEKMYDGRFEGLSPYKVAFIPQTDFREQPWYPSGAVNRGEYAIGSDGHGGGLIRVPGGPPCTLGISQDRIAVDPAHPCRLRCRLRQEGVQGPVTVRLHHEGQTFASATFRPDDQWKEFEERLVPTAAGANATAGISFTGPGTIWIDRVSLMPEDAVGGWRADALAALKALQPGVIRFGGSALDAQQGFGDFEWRDTVGPVTQRKVLRAWGGLQPAGAGLEEIVQLIQASGAEPLICVRLTGRTAKDAADEVEYFNGSTETPMGRLRAEFGHAAPYGIKYWQIGNELSGSEYEKKLPEFCRAMKAVDPHILLCSSYPSPGVLRAAGQWLDYVCPHHYDCANLAGVVKDLEAIRAMLKADAPGRNIRVAVTEWNTTGGDWGVKRARLWTLENALACARYQNLLHRQCDLVEVACRSNLCNSFCSGIIQTDNHRLYKTPTYYMQQLYASEAQAIPVKVMPAFSPEVLPDVSATRSADGAKIALFAVNPTAEDLDRTLDLSAFGKGASELKVWTIRDRDAAGEPDATNNFDDPQRIAVVSSTIRASSLAGVDLRFPKLSITCIEVSGK